MNNRDLLADFQIEQISESMMHFGISELEFAENKRRLRIKFPSSDFDVLEDEQNEIETVSEIEIISEYVGILKLPQRTDDFVKKGDIIAHVESIDILHDIISSADGHIKLNPLLKDGSLLEYGTKIARVNL